MNVLETLKAAVKETGAAHDLAKLALRDYQIDNIGFALGDKVEYGYSHCRKIGIVVSFRESYVGDLVPVVAPIKKDGTAHSVSRDRWPVNPIKLEAK